MSKGALVKELATRAVCLNKANAGLNQTMSLAKRTVTAVAQQRLDKNRNLLPPLRYVPVMLVFVLVCVPVYMLIGCT